MFDVYKRKYEDQPFPRKLIGSFEKYTEVMDLFSLSAEDVAECLAGECIRGYEVDQTMDFLGEGFTHKEIAEILGMKIHAVEVMFGRSIKKMRDSGKLRDFLHLVSKARKKQYSEIKYLERITIEV